MEVSCKGSENLLTQDIKYWVWISLLKKINPSTQKRLIDYCGSPEALWNLDRQDLMEIPFIKPNILKQLLDKDTRASTDIIIEKMLQNNIRILTIYDDNYPLGLRHIYDAPVVLYVKGTIFSDEIIIGIVGSRHATRYGKDLAKRIGFELARNKVTVISGMARGIDTYSHLGAIEGRGRTIAVLGCGLDIVYPPENIEIMKEIEQRGALVSEYPPGEEPKPYNFPPRNRIISGASIGVIVVEAGEKSGSLITTNYALEQGREVFAVPGSVLSPNSVGTNRLIREGAKIVTCMEDIFEELKIYFNDNENNTQQKGVNAIINSLKDEERIIGTVLGNNELHIDKIKEKTNIEIGRLNSLLVIMEMRGIVEQLPGKVYRINYTSSVF